MNTVDTISSPSSVSTLPRQRRTYPKSFKAQVVQECCQPGASIANIALSHGLNANLVHKWIRLMQAQQSMARQPAFVPLPFAPPQPANAASAAGPTIRIAVPHARGTVVVDWPLESSSACASWLRELLR